MIGQGRPNTWQPAAVGKSPSADGPATEYRWGISRGNAARLCRQSSRRVTPRKTPALSMRAFHAVRVTLVTVSLAIMATPLLVSADEPALRLRMEWGGGNGQLWKGSISLPDGTLAEPTPLVVEADVPGSLWSDGSTLHIQPRSVRAYDGVDFSGCGAAKFVFATDSIES